MLSAAVAALGFLTFGKYPHFDYIYISVLLVLIALNLKERNLLSVLLIAFADQLLGVITFKILMAGLLYKIPVYILLIYLAWRLRYAQLGALAIALLIIVLGAECYWAVKDYPAPAIHFYLLLMFTVLLMRRCLFLRTIIFRSWGATALPIDWHYYYLLAVFIYIDVAMLGEYLLRHLFAVQSLFIYDIYPYIIHIIHALLLLAFSAEYLARYPRFRA
jgi:hypothetical protein